MNSSPHLWPPAGISAELCARFREGVPTITTDRTHLRAMKLDDFHAWAEVHCSERAQWMGGQCAPDDAFTEFAASAGSWLLRGFGCWTIEDPATLDVFGFVCLHLDPSVLEIELGYFLREYAEGRGLAFEAATAVRDWAWAQGLPSIVSYISPANFRSVALAERIGGRLDSDAKVPNAPGKMVYRHPRPAFFDNAVCQQDADVAHHRETDLP
jgi:RimJ/RimL family protein N-acetyltransferase